MDNVIYIRDWVIARYKRMFPIVIPPEPVEPILADVLDLDAYRIKRARLKIKADHKERIKKVREEYSAKTNSEEIQLKDLYKSLDIHDE